MNDVPSLRSQQIDANGLELVASDGRSFTRAARLTKTIQGMKSLGVRG